jgi:hypothetical protein
MALANLLAYLVVFGLPIWLVADALAPALTTAATRAGLERRAAEGVRAHASYV